MIETTEVGVTQQPKQTILAQRISQNVSAAVTSIHKQKTPTIVIQPPEEKPPRKRGNGAAKVRPCHVCGELAGRHSYYGGECCPSCRAFFRRSVQSGYNDTYCCVKDNDCEVTLRTRKNCQFCRYNKCLAIGMKTTWVLSEEERKEKFDGRKINRKRKLSKDASGECEEEDDPVVDNNLITDDEMLELNELLRVSGHNDQSKLDMDVELIRSIIKYVKTSEFLFYILFYIYRLIAFRYPLPAEGQSQMREVLSRRFRKLAKSLKEFQSLPSRDKDEILNQNIPIMVELQICTFFNPDLMWRDQLSTFIGTQEIETLDRKLKSMEVQGLDDMKINYLDMFHPGDPDLSETFLEIVRDVGSWPQVNNFQASSKYFWLQHSNIYVQDAYEFVLLCNVVLFCPDLLQLQRDEQTQQVQNKFAVLLYKYLNKKYVFTIIYDNL